MSAFQSLVGAIFVFIGNTFLLDEFYNAALPGIDIDAVIATSATGFRTLIVEARLPALLNVYRLGSRFRAWHSSLSGTNIGRRTSSLVSRHVPSRYNDASAWLRLIITQAQLSHPAFPLFKRHQRHSS